MEMFNLILKKGLTPNQFYFLYTIKEKIAPLNINIHQELRILEGNEWLEKVIPNEAPILTPKAITLVQQVEDFFKVHDTKVTNQLMGRNSGDKIQEFLEIFPKIKSPTHHKPLRSEKTNTANAFKWFFKTYKYSWETILEASNLYVNEYKDKDYKYMQTAQYFVRRDGISALADYCAMVEDGYEEDNKNFTEKVV